MRDLTANEMYRLIKRPADIVRVGKTRRQPCAGGCGALVWDGYCRKCRRAQKRQAQ